jgi:hypothetical protein
MSHNILTGALLLSVAAIAPARAQGMSGPMGGGFHPVVKGGGDTKSTREAPPAALPGTLGREDTTVPLTHPATDLAPTEALFDAINRGDIGSARDAIGRGADLTGQNVLGMTPLDLSVDLGRNDITFLLLSLRGTGPAKVATAAAGQPAKPGAKPGTQTAQLQTKTAPTRTAQATARKVPVRAVAATTVAKAPVTPPPQPAARQFANGGTPVPQAGFLGFGGVTQ